MNRFRWAVGGFLLAGVVYGLARREDAGRRRRTALRTQTEDQQEPILGYDGMDQETLLEWLDDAELDGDQIEQIIRYEERHARREPILTNLHERIG